MDEERKAEVDRLLEEVISREVEDRHAYLLSVCPDEEVRQEVLSLLSWHERAGSFLEAPLANSPPGGF